MGFVEHDSFKDTTGLITLVGGPFGPVPVSHMLRGPAAQDVFFEGSEGTADDDDSNGRDEVETELVSLNLTGSGMTLTLNPTRRSVGQIEERVNNTPGWLDLDPFAVGTADSFFDVFFQIDVGGGFVLHNVTPIRTEAVLDEKPDATHHFFVLPPGGPIELFDANNNPTGIFLVEGDHYTGFVERDFFEDTEAVFELIDPSGVSEVIVARGPTTVDVYFEGAEGDAADDDGNNRDDVETEIVSMDLTGNSSLGPVSVRLNPNMPTFGEIEELVNNNPGRLDLDPFHPGDAQSFFDVFVEIEVQTPVGAVLLYNLLPKRMSAVITDKPPGLGNTYEDVRRVELYTASGEPSGFSLGATRHTPRPIPEPGLDFGDAPERDDLLMYPTTLANNGARHPITEKGVFFGDRTDRPDAEPDGQPDLAALGDDRDIVFPPANDDEDGVKFPAPLTPGDSRAKVDIDMTGSPVGGFVNAWIDFGANGQWTDATDQIIIDKFLTPGVVHTLTFPVPATAQPGRTYARFRIANHGGLRPEGPAEDGEVEDHLVTIGVATLTWDGTDPEEYTSPHWNPGPVAPGGGEAMVVDSGKVIVRSDLTVAPGAAASLDIARNAADGEVSIGPAGKLAVTGEVSVGAGGLLSIDGSLAATRINVAGGSLTNRPQSTGVLDVHGDVVLAAGAVFAIDLLGAGADALVATGAVAIEPNASLEIMITGGDGREFRAGTYTVIKAAPGGLAGTFANVTDLGAYVSVNGNGLTYDPAAGRVTLTLDMNLNPGDANLDGGTDVSDRIIWNVNNFTEGTTFQTGDFNGDGATDVSDRIIWNRYNFTEAVAPPSPLVAPVADLSAAAASSLADPEDVFATAAPPSGDPAANVLVSVQTPSIDLPTAFVSTSSQVESPDTAWPADADEPAAAQLEPDISTGLADILDEPLDAAIAVD